jgi:carbon-monoxide dehydrogenase medium subunit
MWSNFEYIKPRTLGEALDLLSKYKKEAITYAGGTDVLVGMREGEIKPKYVIDIKGLPELNKIKSKNGHWSLGTLVTWSALMNSGTLKKRLPIFNEAAGVFGSPQIRNKATIGGNICTASPSCDLGPVLLVLDAELLVAGKRRKRTIPITKFFLKRKQTSLAKDEILTEIIVKLPPRDMAMAFLKHRRTGVDLAIVNVAVAVRAKKNKFESVKIALGGVAPTPIRAVKAEEELKGMECTDENIERAAQVASGETKPISDVRASAEYRKELAKVLVTRAIKSALQKMGG